MIPVSADQRYLIAPLFKGWDETMIWSCLQGCMGHAWADSLPIPQSAQLHVGDFCFFAGKPEKILAHHLPDFHASSLLLMIAREDGWWPLLQEAYPHGAFCTRYAFGKYSGCFDPDLLSHYAKSLPSGYSMRRIDRTLYRAILQQDWCRDFCSQFSGWEQFKTHGAGFVATLGDEICAGASSYSFYNQGIEIEVDTKETHRRKGLAQACCARLILDCLARGRYPSWDAANLASVHLAQKLGYQISRAYKTFSVPLKIKNVCNN